MNEESRLIRGLIGREDIGNILNEHEDIIRDRFSVTAALNSIMEQKGIGRNELIQLILKSPFNTAKRDSVRRRVDNWLNDIRGINRDMAFQLCILLELNYDEAREFIISTNHPWVHYRNYKDLIYDFSIRNKMDIQSVYNLAVGYSGRGINNNNNNNMGTVNIREEYEEQIEIGNLDNINEFRNFLEANWDEFGSIRKFTTETFCESVNTFCEEDVSFDDLAKALIGTFQFCGYDYYDNEGEKALRRARESLAVRLRSCYNGESDVPREIIVAVLLAAYPAKITEEDINAILYDCGYHKLSARLIFDALVLDAINSAQNDKRNSAFDILCDNVQRIIYHDSRIGNKY